MRSDVFAESHAQFLLASTVQKVTLGIFMICGGFQLPGKWLGNSESWKCTPAKVAKVQKQYARSRVTNLSDLRDH